MKVVALISGGKDSCYNMMQCVDQGHEIVALANLRPSNTDELDSYMYQTVGHHAIDLYSQAIGLPLYRRTIKGEPVEQGKDYVCNDKDEVEDLYELLKNIKSKIEFDAVAVGAVLSDYQRVRVENVCSRLGLLCLAYLWRRKQKELLEEMISCHVEAIIIKVAALGLDPQKHLGKNLSEMYSHLCDINEKFGCHICGEGGEYETFTLDCPLFQKKIVVDTSDVVIHSDDAFAPVGYLNLKEIHLENKIHAKAQVNNLLKDTPLHRGDMLIISEHEMQSLVEKTDSENNMLTNTLEIFGEPHEPTTYTDRVMTKQSNQFAWISGVKADGSPTKSIEDETDLAMKQLDKTVKQIGSNLQHVLLVHIYINNMKNYAAINSVYGRYFDVNPPARVCVETNFLDSTMFQLDCLTITPNNTKQCSLSRMKHDAMHVQSISHWAPANIGPYSQVIKVNEITGYVAGCIGLWPSSMSIVDGGIYQEASLALRHVARILEAFIPGTSISDVISGVCYVTKPSYVPIAMAVWMNSCKMYDSMPSSDDNCIKVKRDGDNQDNIVYVVVDDLPKGALVEWHVVSHRCRLPVKHELLVDGFENIKISLTSFVCPLHMCGSINANTEIKFPLSSKINICEMVEHFVKTLGSFITSRGLAVNMLLVLRIFYRTDVFGANHLILKKAFHDATQDTHETTCPTMVFVPVSGLFSAAQVVSVSGWLQTALQRDQ